MFNSKKNWNNRNLIMFLAHFHKIWLCWETVLWGASWSLRLPLAALWEIKKREINSCTDAHQHDDQHYTPNQITRLSSSGGCNKSSHNLVVLVTLLLIFTLGKCNIVVMVCIPQIFCITFNYSLSFRTMSMSVQMSSNISFGSNTT